MPQVAQVVPGVLTAALANGSPDFSKIIPAVPGTPPPFDLGTTGDVWALVGGDLALVGRFNGLQIGIDLNVPAWPAAGGLEMPEAVNYFGVQLPVQQTTEETIAIVAARPPQGSEAGFGSRGHFGNATQTAADGGFLFSSTAASGFTAIDRGIATNRSFAVASAAIGTNFFLARSYSGSANSNAGSRRSYVGGVGAYDDAGQIVLPTTAARMPIWLGARWYPGFGRDTTAFLVIYYPYALTLAQLDALYAWAKAYLASFGIVVF